MIVHAANVGVFKLEDGVMESLEGAVRAGKLNTKKKKKRYIYWVFSFFVILLTNTF